MRAFLLALAPALILAAGCNKSRPTMAGGKPVQHWLEAAHDPNPAVRKTAITKLGNVGTADPAAVPALLEALDDGDARVRYEAILAVLKIGAAAQQAVPRLTELARSDRDPAVRQTAARALERIQGDSAPAS